MVYKGIEEVRKDFAEGVECTQAEAPEISVWLDIKKGDAIFRQKGRMASPEVKYNETELPVS